MSERYLKRRLFYAPLFVALLLCMPVVTMPASGAAAPVGWYAQDSGTAERLNAVGTAGASTGWAVGDAGTILRTGNGGDTWLPQGSGTSLNLTDICVVSSSTAWVVGGDGAGAFIVLRTSDGGEDWDTIAAGTGYNLSDITAVDAATAWVAGWGGGGVISKTSDGGKTWNIQPTGTTQAICDIKAVDANTVWAVGGTGSFPGNVEGGMILKSTNGGWAWSTQTDPLTQMGEKVMWTAVEAVDSENAWILGAYQFGTGPFAFSVGTYAKTGDGGATWHAPYMGSYGFSTGMDISAVDASTAWVAGLTSSSGNISKTSNGGVTWACPQASEPVVDLYDIAAVNQDAAWAVGSNGTILHTDNGGCTLQAPHIDSISPTSGMAGGIDPIQITIAGNGFGASQGMSLAIAFGPWPIATVDAWSDTEIEFTVSTSIISLLPSGPYDVTVTTAAGGISNAAIFTLEGGGLEVHAISPDRGIQYTLVMDIGNLSGAGFQPGAMVRLENETAAIGPLSVTVISPIQIAFSVSLFWAQPGVYDVVVTNPDGGEARLENGFTVDPVCGSGSGTAVLMLGLTLGLITLAGSSHLLKRRR
jgi:photosystem II stability/assembly factor-like uncharacterized protein